MLHAMWLLAGCRMLRHPTSGNDISIPDPEKRLAQTYQKYYWLLLADAVAVAAADVADVADAAC